MAMSMYPSPAKMKMSTSSCFPGRYSPSYRAPDQMRRCMGNPSGDIFSGLNDGILSRAEALVDIGKHQGGHAQMSSQLKHYVMYHHGMGGPPQRPLQMHHTMVGLEMLDPANSMTTLTPMSEAPSITSSHHQLHATSYHGMNHMMGHHHSGSLGGHTPSMNH